MNEAVAKSSTSQRSVHVQCSRADVGAALLGVRDDGAGAMDLDRDLIAAGREYAALEDEYGVICRSEDYSREGTPEQEALEARLEAISDRQGEIYDMMCEATPRTAEGLRAMALAAACWAADSSTASHPTNPEERLSYAVLMRILGRA